MRKLLFAMSAIGALILRRQRLCGRTGQAGHCTVVKISGIPWFNRMEVGVKAFQDANPDVVTSESRPPPPMLPPAAPDHRGLDRPWRERFGRGAHGSRRDRGRSQACDGPRHRRRHP